MIEALEVAPLFGEAGAERDRVDTALRELASTIGVLLISGPPELIPCDEATRARLLAVFGLDDAEQRKLWRTSYAPENTAVYRGWSPRGGDVTVDIYDLGPDVAHRDAPGGDDPLLDPTPLPPSELLPGWQELVGNYYRAMERVGAALMRSLARGLGLSEMFFDPAFESGISTLRLMHYQLPPDAAAPAVRPSTSIPGS